MKTYEYKKQLITALELIPILNKEGKSGWRMIEKTVDKGDPLKVLVLFEREI